MINGKRYAWEDITVALPHGTAVDILAISYDSEKDFREVYGKGSMPRGYGAGRYKAEGKLTLLREEFDRLADHCRVAGRGTFFGLPPMPITVVYANEDQPLRTDVLRQCKFRKIATAADEGDEKVEVELEFAILGGITRSGVEDD
jgi:hypothetical protein